MATYEDGTMDVVIDGVECRRPIDTVLVIHHMDGETTCIPRCTPGHNDECEYIYKYGDDRPHIVTLQQK